jgi:hypothetical protein
MKRHSRKPPVIIPEPPKDNSAWIVLIVLGILVFLLGLLSDAVNAVHWPP